MERLVLWHRVVPSPRDDADDWERQAAWTAAVANRFQAARGTLLAVVGTSVAVELEATDLKPGLALALEVLEEAERLEPPLKIGVGAAVGDLPESPQSLPVLRERGYRGGGAIDRAMLLASRARPGELVLDLTAREHAGGDYLFGRQVAAGVGTVRGQCIDRAHPTRAACRPAIRRLGPPVIPPSATEALAAVRELAGSSGIERIVLRGPIGLGAKEWIDALERELGPPLVLRLGAVPGSLEPLGSLRFAILKAWGSSEGAHAAMRAHGVDPHMAQTLGAIARGHAVDRTDAVAALRAVVEAHEGDETRPWIVLDPLSQVDPASVEVVAEATEEGGADCLLLARLANDLDVPKPLVREGALTEIPLPHMRMPDARAVAQSILGPATGEDVARRVAVLGGSTPLGVCEAARALVAAGDLVWEDEAFSWRVGPRSGMTAIPAESLIGERLGALEPDSSRVLEAVCAAPSGAPAELIAAVAHADGLTDVALGGAIEILRAEALLADGEPLLATSNTLRAVVVQSMPPGRAAELCRFIGDAMGELADRQSEFSEATRGYFLAESGLEREGAMLIIEAGRAALLAGFTRPAVRMAAAAVQVDASIETRAAATRLSRASIAKEQPVQPPVGPAPLPDTLVVDLSDEVELIEEDELDLAQLAVRAILDRDFEAVDRHIDIAIAEGRDRSAADRVRAMAHLVRGDVPAAMKALARSREAAGEDDAARARGALARSLVVLGAGDPSQAVRDGLSALAIARGKRDPRGEAAAMHALELCFRVLARDEQAAAIAEASPG